MATIANLSVSITARTAKFVKGLKRARRSLNRFAGQVAGITAKVAGFGAALAGVGGAGYAFYRLVRGTERFNQAMLNSLAIMGDVSDGLKRQMTTTAIDVARVTKFSAEDAARSYFYLASAGLNAQQSIKAMPAVAQFAQAGMFDLAQATDLLTDAQSALGLSSKDASANLQNMTRVSDVLVKANTIANASVEQFSQALTTKAGAALRMLGKDVEEGVAVLAAFADQGVKAQDAGTALHIVMRDLSTKALLNHKAFKAAGVAVYDSAGEMRNLADVLASLEHRFDGMSDAQRKATLLQLGFADKSVAFLQTLLGTSDKIRGYEAALRSAGGMTKDVADKQLTPFAKASARLGAAFIELGQRMTPLINTFAGITEEVAQGVEALAHMRDATTGLIGTRLQEFMDGVRATIRELATTKTIFLWLARIKAGFYAIKAIGMTVWEGLKGAAYLYLSAWAQVVGRIVQTWDLAVGRIKQRIGELATEYGNVLIHIRGMDKVGQELLVQGGAIRAQGAAQVANASDNRFLKASSEWFDRVDSSSRNVVQAWSAYGTAAQDVADIQQQIAHEAKATLEPVAKATETAAAALNTVARTGPGTNKRGLSAWSVELDSMRSKAKAIFEATRTPLERFKAKVMELKELFNAGLLDPYTLGRALDKAKATFMDAAGDPAAQGSFRQIDLSRIAIDGLTRSASQEQRVNDPQLQQVIKELKGMRQELGVQAAVVV